MAGQSKKITIYIFLLAIFIMLGMVIGGRMYNLWISSRTATEATIETTMKCAFSFSLKNIERAGNQVSFDLKTTDEKLLKKIVIMGENNASREIELGVFIGFPSEQKVRVENTDELEIGNSFIIYPSGCEEAKKRCDLSAGTCETLR